MKENHTIKNPLKKRSLQWRLTLLITLLVTVTCILMYFFISNSAVTGMENLESYIVQINKTDSTPITFNVDPSILFPDLSNQVQATKALFRIRSMIATGIIILLSSIGTYFISRRALTPLHDLSTKIGKIQAQNLSESLEIPDSNDEISQLTASFNKMLSRLDDAFTAQKQFSASAAHELRTPLAVMQTNLEVFARKKTPSTEEYQEIFSLIQEQTGRLSHLAEILLDMTGIQTVERSETISLAELTEEVFCDLASVAEQKQIELIQRDGDCTVTGSYLLLYRAVYNLVENAIKYNHPSGKVTVTLHPGKVILDASSQPHPADCAFIEISDTGIGISPEYQEKIFAPFFRVDKSRSRAMGGAGLGLALVTEIARQHGGQVKVLESNEKGSTIALMLPL
ncbi:MAG: HAMP domain-containing protein [Blautia sp.]|nr:HAMP domain-containing protein [Blautia sp.]